MKTSNLLLTIGLVYLVYRLTNKMPVVSKMDQSIINNKQSNITNGCECGSHQQNFTGGTFEYYQPQTIDFKQIVPTPGTVLNFQPSPKFKSQYVC